MTKTSKAKKWAKEHPEAFVYVGYAACATGLVLWVRHAMKTAEVYPVAYGFDMVNEEGAKVLFVHKFFEDDTAKTLTFFMNND